MTLVTFVIFHIVGGDPAFIIAGKNATVEQIENIRSQLGLDKPFYQQYFDFLTQTLTFDWGRSWSSEQKISSLFWQGLGPSLSLTLPSFFISFFLCILISILSAYYRGSFLDRSITVACLTMMSISFLVYIICFQYLFSYYFNIFPVAGWESGLVERWQYLILPWIISISVTLGPGILIYRSAILDEIHKDYVRTAKAKGLNNSTVYFRHILKNAMIPIVTIVVMRMPFLIMGSLLLETFFAIPGLGGILIQAINSSDFPVIKAITVIGSILYIFFNLLSDILYTVVDPRVKLS